MRDAYVIGTSSTAFQKWPERSFRDLSDDVVRAVLADAGLADATQSDSLIGNVWFANCGMHAFGQANIRGQAALTPLLNDGVLPPWTPIANVEGGCATGTLAFQAAVRDVLSGEVRCSLAVGVEKTIVPDDPMKTVALFKGGADQMHQDEWLPMVEAAAARVGLPFALHPARILFLDTYAMQTLQHMKRWGTTPEQLALVAAKNHHNGTLNPKAQYRFEVTMEQALADRAVAGPLTRSMCCPVSDGAAAALICSADVLAGLPKAVQDRAIKVRACVVAGGRQRDLEEESLTWTASARAWARAGVTPEDIDVVELHDSTAYCEIAATEALGFCERGGGGPLVESGETRLGGRMPINPSGGLISKGHPLAATGLGMIDELVVQLRGEAGARQAGAPRLGLAQNAGGLMGFDEALCGVTVLERMG
ncbi:MAG: acetyl-CoA acetyltransferase [Myxococcota bacterium]|jgi:acetyl-CoA acetyltransferase